jgi:hypothetical protein
MAKWKTTCGAHPDFSKTVEADTKEAAVDMMMMDTDFAAHAKELHPEMQGKSMEEMKAMMASMTEMVM